VADERIRSEELDGLGPITKEAVKHAELSPKGGEGTNRAGGISWGCLTPPFLHRMPWLQSDSVQISYPPGDPGLTQAGVFDDQLTDGGGFPGQVRGVEDALCATTVCRSGR
jgi:hypothetical protein